MLKTSFNTYYNRMIVHNMDMWLNVKDTFNNLLQQNDCA